MYKIIWRAPNYAGYINSITILSRQYLYLERSIFDNIYNNDPFIPYCNFVSRIVIPDGLKSPILSDGSDLLRIDGITMLVRVN